MTLAEAIEFYQDANNDNTCDAGGFDDCIEELNGVVAVAVWSDDSGVSLEMLTAQDFIDWMDRSVDFVNDSPEDDYDNWSAINETREDKQQ